MTVKEKALVILWGGAGLDSEQINLLQNEFNGWVAVSFENQKTEEISGEKSSNDIEVENKINSSRVLVFPTPKNPLAALIFGFLIRERYGRISERFIGETFPRIFLLDSDNKGGCFLEEI